VYLYLMIHTKPAVIPDHPRYGKIQAFTLSPNPKYYNSYDPVGQYEQILMAIFRYVPLRRALSKFVFVPELNANGNIHIHGMYYIKNKYAYNRWFLPACKHWGWTLVKDKNIDQEWVEYIYEDLLETQDILSCDENGQLMPVPMTKESLREYTYVHELKHVKNAIPVKNLKKHKITDYF